MKTLELKAGYVNFKNRNWGYRGDKGSWIKIEKSEGTKVIINKASNGIISSAYTDELIAYCNDFGVDFAAMKSGERIMVEV